MPMTVEERVAKASATRIANARARRFQRYGEEMTQHPRDIPPALLGFMIDGLRGMGWTVTPPAATTKTP